MKKSEMRTYSQNHSGKEVFLELPFKIIDKVTYTKDGKKKTEYLHFAPSLNKMLRLSKKRFAWNTYKRKGEDYLCALIKQQTKVRFEGMVGMTFQRHAVSLIDPDSLGASCKLILDALQACNVIVEDDPGHIKYYPEQYKVSSYEDEKIIVKIWEI